ncbi:hypothetical protein C1N71_06685 [Agrococcus sp. SGAir0287]|nr:hypothetical protein C1N71_06685 [Agrococcus sp. SGAir0287]
MLRPQGALLVGFHVGDDVQRSTQGYTGRPIAVDTHRRPPERVERWMRDAGFAIDATLVMAPHGDRPGALIFAPRDADPRVDDVG